MKVLVLDWYSWLTPIHLTGFEICSTTDQTAIFSVHVPACGVSYKSRTVAGEGSFTIPSPDVGQGGPTPRIVRRRLSLRAEPRAYNILYWDRKERILGIQAPFQSTGTEPCLFNDRIKFREQPREEYCNHSNSMKNLFIVKFILQLLALQLCRF